MPKKAKRSQAVKIKIDGRPVTFVIDEKAKGMRNITRESGRSACSYPVKQFNWQRVNDIKVTLDGKDHLIEVDEEITQLIVAAHGRSLAFK